MFSSHFEYVPQDNHRIGPEGDAVNLVATFQLLRNELVHLDQQGGTCQLHLRHTNTTRQ